MPGPEATGTNKTQEVPHEHQDTPFHHESSWVLAQVAQEGGEVSIFGDTQNHLDIVLGNWP